jgi:hypothetical protein
MNETLSELSEWWVADDPDQRAVGELHFDSAEGAHLTLMDRLPGIHHTRFFLPTLLGQSLDGTLLTLFRPIILQQTNFGGSGRTRTRIHGQILLRGGHADSIEGFVVSRARVRLSGLRELCLRPALIDGEMTSFLRAMGPTEQRVVVAGGSLTFLHGISRSNTRFGQSSEEDVDALIEADDPLPLDEFEEQWVRPLEALVILANREPTVLQGFTVLLEDAGAWESVDPALRGRTTPEVWNEIHVDVLTPTPDLTAEPSSEYDRPLVPFAALGTDSHAFIAHWWGLHAQLGVAAGFLMSAWGSRMFLEHKLLNQMSFSESYHRIKHDEPAIPAEDHERNVEAMLAVIEDKTQREHYRQKLRYADEQNARRRLKWLIKRTHETLHDVPGLNAATADRLVETRNALTHLDPSGPPAMEGADLFYAVRRLELVIQTNILLDLELDPAFVSGLVKTSYVNQVPLIDFRGADDR